MDDERLIWFGLRGRRAVLRDRSKLNETAARQQTFAAAMGQFEEQFTAANVVTDATRPLNLYYGLAQAGMAIAAAYADDPWRFSRHGLRLTNWGGELADMLVAPEGDGGFQKVGTATGSQLLSGPVSLGALWASLPELSDAGLLPGSDTPPPIALLGNQAPGNVPRATLFPSGDLLSRDLEPGSDPWRQRFGEIMKAYPGTENIAIPATEGSINPPGPDAQNWGIGVAWLDAQATRDLSTAELKEFFDKIAPEYRYQQDRFLRPAIDADDTAPPSPLMTWWLLLYSFSMLARYHPREWTTLLELDKTKNAVLLQYALAEALTVVPHLVLEALDRKPFLLAKPMRF
jgi:hypothetical protein